jgi:hypothetical protein
VAGYPDRHELTGPDGGPLALVNESLGDLSRLSDEGLEQLGRLMEITHDDG